VPNDEDTLAHPEQPRFLLPAWVWAVVLFGFFGVIVAIAFGAMSRGSTYEDDRAKARAEKLKTAQKQWNQTAESYGWVDKTKGVAHIPIPRAMMLEVSDLQAKQPQAAGPIATPAPAEASAAATGAAPPTNPAAAASPAMSATPPPISIEGLKSENRGQPAGAANPPNAAPATQPGASATPAAAPQSHSQVPAVSPRATPVQHPVGTPLPVPGASPARTSPAPPHGGKP
jgi:hypothetical protein